jgi:hypothetical protein
VLALASVPLFFAAAWIESFVRESALGTPARMAVALGGVLLLTGLGGLIRRTAAEPSPSPSSDWLDRLIASPEPPDPRAQAAP